MKKLIFLFSVLLISIQLYAVKQETEKTVVMSGKCGIISSNSVNVTISNNNLVRTTFLQDMPATTVSVKGKSGEVISRQKVEAKEFDRVTIQVPPGKEGDYYIEIASPEGVLNGKL